MHLVLARSFWLLLLAAAFPAHASLLTYEFTLNGGPTGPLANVESTGYFSFDSNIVPSLEPWQLGSFTPEPGENLFSEFRFTWDGVTYTEDSIKTGLLGFDSSGLREIFFGTNCDSSSSLSVGCGISYPSNDWYLVASTFDNVDDGFGNFFAYGVGSDEPFTGVGSYTGSATFGETTPEPPPIPVSSSPTHDVRLSTFSVTNSIDGDAVSQITTVGFDPTAPTYVVTHGWQSSADYSTPDWSFTEQTRPSNLDETLDAIESRLLSEAVDDNGDPLKVNVVLAEWAGAYTGGSIFDAIFNGPIYPNSALARYNSDYAGLLLGIALEDQLGGDYNQDLHFIGHSYGAIVNGLATKYLSQTGSFNSDQQTIQFTTLDAPTNRDLFAPNFPDDWFSTNIATQIDYFDNYYGDGLFAFGESYIGNFNQKVGYSHVKVGLSPGIWEGFYDSLIIEGADADTRGFVSRFEDWATPALGTIPIDGRFIPRLFGSEERRWDTSDVVFKNLVNAETIKLNTFTLYDCGGSRWSNDVCGNQTKTYSFKGVFIEERSPVAFSQFIEFPEYAGYLSFDWMVASGGDGDWFSLFFGDQLLWNMGIDPLFEGILNRAFVDISQFAGMSGDLIFSLFSTGESNAALYLGDLTVLSDPTSVPEPPVLALLMFGLGMIVLLRKRRIRVRK